MIGQKLNNRYTVTARLGKGAMGTVYRATDSKSGQEVALKIISGELAIQPEMLERFKREGEALRRLKHPNIVEFIDAFEYEEQYVIVMEYIPGGSLHELIKQGLLPVEQARRIALELCDALIRSHHLNIIHRDIKPENILIAEDGTPKLADFGVAHLSQGTRLTRSGTQVGTPYYMSPEAWEGKELDAQADIWSLGVVMFEMLTGQVPFGGDTGAAVMNKVLTMQPPDLKKLRADVSPGWATTIRRMLMREKNKRYSTMRQVAVDLEPIQIATTRDPARKVKPGGWLLALIGLGLTAIVSAVWLVARSPHSQSTAQVAESSTSLGPAATRIGTPAQTNTPNPLQLGERLLICGTDVCIADYKGTVISPLGLGSEFTNFRGFAWSKDKTRVVFSACPLQDYLSNPTSECYANIYQAKPDGSDALMLAKGDSGNSLESPTWSPDDQWIVFGRSGAIKIIHPDGTGAADLTSYNSAFALAFATAWSPDSQQIATVGGTCTGRGSTCILNRIALINRDGSGFRFLYYSAEVEFEPEIAWSPDGKQVAVKLTNGKAYIIDAACKSSGLDGCAEDSRTPIPSIPPDWLPTFRPQWLSAYVDPRAAVNGCQFGDKLLYAEDFDGTDLANQLGPVKVEKAPDGGNALRMQGHSDYILVNTSVQERRISFRVLRQKGEWNFNFRGAEQGAARIAYNVATFPNSDEPLNLRLYVEPNWSVLGTGARIPADAWTTVEIIWEDAKTIVVRQNGNEAIRYVETGNVIERGTISLYTLGAEADVWFDDFVICGQE